jgi:hypothetical protein
MAGQSAGNPKFTKKKIPLKSICIEWDPQRLHVSGLN